ncbi:MAG: nitrilase-related carbon-nitrogen hydrolase [bacterium]
MKRILRLHLVQFPTRAGHALETLRAIERDLAKLRVRRDDWLVFPEMWPSGFSLQERDRLRRENTRCADWLRDFARGHACYLVGSMLELRGGKAYNQAYVVGPSGRRLAAYRKIHLFEYGGEHLRFERGRKVVAFSSPWGRLGLAICYDLRFPELFRRLSAAGARLIFVPSAWPRERIDHFSSLLKARAIENQCYIVGLNKVGPGMHREPVVYGGHSAVFGPWGEQLAELGSRKEIRSVSLPLDAVEKIRVRYPFLRSRILA